MAGGCEIPPTINEFTSSLHAVEFHRAYIDFKHRAYIEFKHRAYIRLSLHQAYIEPTFGKQESI